MRKIKNSVLTKSFLLFGAAAALLLTSTVGSTRAALTYRSESYGMQITVPTIGVSLEENGDVVNKRDYIDNEWVLGEDKGLLQNMLKSDSSLKEDDQKLVLGKEYQEELAVTNSGSIDTYVRAIVYRYWTKNGETVADTELSPELIEMDLGGNGWVIDETASTKERTVLYYSSILPSKGTSNPFNTKLSINESIGSKVTKTTTTTTNGDIIETKFAYDGYQFNVKVEVDAVQTHNAEDAIRSAWGVDMSVLNSGGTSAGGQ